MNKQASQTMRISDSKTFMLITQIENERLKLKEKSDSESQPSHQVLINSFQRLPLHAEVLSLLMAYVRLCKYSPLSFSNNAITTGYYFHCSESWEAETQSQSVFKWDQWHPLRKFLKLNSFLLHTLSIKFNMHTLLFCCCI